MARSHPTHSGVPITRHIKVKVNRSPYDGDWVYWSTRQGRHPHASPRLAKLLKAQHGRCRYCGLFFPDSIGFRGS